MQPAIDARDKELKTILTEEEFKKWKDELEPALMQRRGGATGNNNLGLMVVNPIPGC